MRKLGVFASMAALTVLLSGAAFTWGYWRFPRFWHLPSGRNPMPGDDRTERRGDSSHTYPHVSNVGRHERAADDETVGGGWILLGILAVIAVVVILALVL